MSLILPRDNRLAFPVGRMAGIDLTNPLSRMLRFSGVTSSGGNIFSLNKTSVGALQGAATFAVDGILGACINAVITPDGSRFTGNAVVNDLSMTIAAIMRYTVLSGANQTTFATSGANNGWRLYSSTLSTLAIVAGGVVARNSTLNLVANTPYLIIGSMNAGGGLYLSRDLSTGKIQTSTSAGATPTINDGTYSVCTDFNADCMRGKLAAVMFAGRFTTLTEMYQMAQDPWAFWYPRKQTSVSTPPPDIRYPFGISYGGGQSITRMIGY